MTKAALFVSVLESKEQHVCLVFARCQQPPPPPHTSPHTRTHTHAFVFLLFSHTDRVQFTGSIAVLNLAFEKRVFVRYTFDEWQAHSDADAFFSWRDTKAETGVDSFAFHIPIRLQDMVVGKRLQFVLG